jgi:hypothetical protein
MNYIRKPTLLIRIGWVSEACFEVTSFDLDSSTQPERTASATAACGVRDGDGLGHKLMLYRGQILPSKATDDAFKNNRLC